MKEDFEATKKKEPAATNPSGLTKNTISSKYRITKKKGSENKPASGSPSKSSFGFKNMISGGYFSSRGENTKLQVASHPKADVRVATFDAEWQNFKKVGYSRG